jgi:hypothetical protein
VLLAAEWRVSIPVAADAAGVNRTVGAAMILDSGLQVRTASWYFITSTMIAPDTMFGTRHPRAALTSVSRHGETLTYPTTPWTW